MIEDDLNHSTTDSDVFAEGIAAESAEADSDILRLPRVARYAILVKDRHERLPARLAADIAEHAPRRKSSAARWARKPSQAAGARLAKALDRLAVRNDAPTCRSIAVTVRMLSLRTVDVAQNREDHQIVADALFASLSSLPVDAPSRLRVELEQIALGWAALPTAIKRMRHFSGYPAIQTAAILAGDLTRYVIEEASNAAHAQQETSPLAALRKASEASNREQDDGEIDVIDVPDGHVVICSMPESELKASKLREIVRGHEATINAALPLVETPRLADVRARLLFEFPYAQQLIDYVLGDLIGKPHVRLQPLLFVGEPGGGKTRFVRRLAQLLRVGLWRTDGSSADGAAFGGTQRRWHTAEPCHAFLAISRYKIANPMVLVDEIDKAATRQDYGRLWDSLLGFLEPESAAAYMDPALQVELNLAAVSFIATANRTEPLPPPLQDRMRITEFPSPRLGDLDALIAPVIADISGNLGVDSRWFAPVSQLERDVLARQWRGGSVRRLRRMIEVILRHRDRSAARH